MVIHSIWQWVILPVGGSTNSIIKAIILHDLKWLHIYYEYGRRRLMWMNLKQYWWATQGQTGYAVESVSTTTKILLIGVQ